MKLTILVIASSNLSIYTQHEACWRSYASSNPDVTVYFVRQREDVATTHIVGDTIWSNGREATERVFEKTVAAFKFLPPNSYDYIVRTNLSSVWNFERLIEFCKTLPKDNVFCGVLGNPGISGAGMILSPDVVSKLSEHCDIPDRCMWDDVDFGKIACAQGIVPIPAHRYDPVSRSDVDQCFMLGYHFYLKNMSTGKRDISNEIDVMSYLIRKIYPPDVDLVVAVYKEPVDWILSLPVRRVYIYLKDSTRLEDVKRRIPSAIVTCLPNIGREAHSYIHHITTHYSTLGAHTLFLQGNPFDHCTKNDIDQLLENPAEEFVALGVQYVSDGNGYPEHPNLPVSQVFQTYFGEPPQTFVFRAGAQFMVSRERIHRYPIDMYTRLSSADATTPQLPWCMERFWPYVFNL